MAARRRGTLALRRGARARRGAANSIGRIHALLDADGDARRPEPRARLVMITNGPTAVALSIGAYVDRQ